MRAVLMNDPRIHYTVIPGLDPGIQSATEF